MVMLQCCVVGRPECWFCSLLWSDALLIPQSLHLLSPSYFRFLPTVAFLASLATCLFLSSLPILLSLLFPSLIWASLPLFRSSARTTHEQVLYHQPQCLSPLLPFLVCSVLFLPYHLPHSPSFPSALSHLLFPSFSVPFPSLSPGP